jgi:hypothetical protein
MAAPTLLTLPRELRDEIYRHFLLPPGFCKCEPSRNRYALRTTLATYIDKTIFLPARLPPNLLQVCRQMRTEALQTLMDIANSPPLRTRLRSALSESSNSTADEYSTRARETDPWPQVAMDVQVAVRVSYGSFIPERTELSPTLLVHLPILQHVRQLQFAIWPGWLWWNGPKEKRATSILPNISSMRAHRSALSPDQMYERTTPALVQTGEPDALGVAVETVLARLPCVQDVEIDVFMHLADYWNWDLPDRRWVRAKGWLDAPVEKGAGRRWKRVKRQLMVLNFSSPCMQIPIFTKTEMWKRDEVEVEGEVKGRLVNVVEEIIDVRLSFVRSLIVGTWSSAELTLQLCDEWDESTARYTRRETDETKTYTRFDPVVEQAEASSTWGEWMADKLHIS